MANLHIAFFGKGHVATRLPWTLGPALEAGFRPSK